MEFALTIGFGVLPIGDGAHEVAAGDDPRFPTVAEKAALAGSGETPNGGNRYVTDADAAPKPVVKHVVETMIDEHMRVPGELEDWLNGLA
mgnify:CR=1 FL=1